jgi:acyl-CoA reductase-like NAD-dependent aldehyde dehydrogenase
MAFPAAKALHTEADIPAYSLYIGGAWTPALDGAVADDFNPATGALFARVSQAGRADAERAVEAAYAAREGWARTIVSERAAFLLRAADVLAGKVEEIREVLIDESGSTFGKAMFEVSYCIDLLRSAAGDARHIFGETLPHSMPGQVGMTRNEESRSGSGSGQLLRVEAVRRNARHGSEDSADIPRRRTSRRCS